MRRKNLGIRILLITAVAVQLLLIGSLCVWAETQDADADKAAGAYLTTDETTYAVGDPITVTADGPGEKAWVGLFEAGKTPAPGGYKYWYYLSNGRTTDLSGVPVVLQEVNQFTNAAKVLPAGSYDVVLFNDSGYTAILASVRITVVEAAGYELKPFESIEYELDNATDGFANGKVTVHRGQDNFNAAECTLYWADADGKPLPGYTKIFTFRLNGSTTVKEMYPYTVIPPEARKLIAFAGNGSHVVSEAAAVDLPSGCNYGLEGLGDAAGAGDSAASYQEFQIISDVHVSPSGGAFGESNGHFSLMLEDVKANSPNSLGIFMNGDIADRGMAEDYEQVLTLYNAANTDNSLPALHMAVGNHDWMNGNPDNQFQRYAALFNPTLEQAPETIYYTEVTGGIPFIYLGQETTDGNANLSKKQLSWLDEQMRRYSADYPGVPVFVFLHQPIYDTVAGSLPGQNWDGVVNVEEFESVLKKYNQIILLGGHSHWVLTSERCLFPGSIDAPIAVNTAASGYLWTSYNIIEGEYEHGSQGYFVRVYDDKVVLLGRDFEHQLFMPSAMLVVRKNEITTSADSYSLKSGGSNVDMGVALACGKNTDATYSVSDPDVVSVTRTGKLVPEGIGDADVFINAPAAGTFVIDRKTVHVSVSSGGDDALEALKLENQKLKIRLMKVAGLKVTSRKGRSASVKFRSLGDGFSYEVKYSAKKTRGFKTACVTKKPKAVIKKLKKAKAYYVKVRGVKTVGGEKVYTQFSKTVKIKK